MIKYMYIDESGDLGSQSDYLVLAALLVDDPADLDRLIKNMRRNKFRKHLRSATEIRANNSSDEVICYMLERLNGVPGARVYYLVLEKARMYSPYLWQNKHKLYNFVAGKLAKNIVLEELDVVVRIDKSKGKQMLRDDFNAYFEQNLAQRSTIRKIEIHHSYSHSWSGLQFADILSWSAFQKFEHDDPSYVDLLAIPQEVWVLWD